MGPSHYIDITEIEITIVGVKYFFSALTHLTQNKECEVLLAFCLYPYKFCEIGGLVEVLSNTRNCIYLYHQE